MLCGAKSLQSCPTLWDPVDCNPPGSSVPRILQAILLEWVAIPFSRGIFLTQGSNPCLIIAGSFFTIWATREAQEYWSGQPIPSPGDHPNSGIKLRSPALQADSLPTELSGKPPVLLNWFLLIITYYLLLFYILLCWDLLKALQKLQYFRPCTQY